MPEPTDSASPQKLASQTEVNQALNANKADRADLNGRLDRLQRDLWTDVLCMLEEIFPHDPTKEGCPSDPALRERNAKLFTAYRHRVLRTGNNVKREQERLLGCYLVRQLIERTVTTHVVAGHGPYGLPKGVIVREPKQ